MNSRMKRLHVAFEMILIAVFISRATAATDKMKSGRRIIGGGFIDIELYPWHVSVVADDYYICGGSIIADEFILTAAHCVFTKPNRSEPKFQIRYATHTLLHEDRQVNVKKVHRHPDYVGKEENFDNDIAILELESKIVYTRKSKKVVLSLGDPKDGDSAYATGFGKHSPEVLEGEISRRLRGTLLYIENWKNCLTKFVSDLRDHRLITKGQICAKNGNQGTCKGDSGGALTIALKQVGIVSWKKNECANPNYPEVFTNVGYYQDFIDEVTKGTAEWGCIC